MTALLSTPQAAGAASMPPTTVPVPPGPQVPPPQSQSAASVSQTAPTASREHDKPRGAFRTREPFFPTTLVFSPLAWLQLNFLCHAADTEIGCFGIAAHDQPFYIESLGIIRQRCSAVSVEFNDHAVADFFDEQIDEGRTPDLFARVWIHTHPGTSADPSGVDEETFQRVFGSCDWAVMFILAKGGQVTCRLRVNAGGSGGRRLAVDRDLHVRVDWEEIVTAPDLDQREKWWEEYARNVEVLEYRWPQQGQKSASSGPRAKVGPPSGRHSETELLDWFDGLEPDEQRKFLRGMRGLPDQADYAEDDPRWADQFSEDDRDPWDEMIEAEAALVQQDIADRRARHAE